MLLTLCLLPFIARAEAIELSSQNIKALVTEANRKVEASRLEKDAAEIRRGLFFRSFLPSVEVYGAQERFRKGRMPQKDQPSYGAEASLNLFNGGRDWLESESRDLEAERRDFTTQKVLAEELASARNLYWETRYLTEKLALLKETLSVNQENLNAALRRIKSGVATNSDRFEFEMKDVELRREMAETEVKVQTNKQLLALALGREGADFTFPEPLDHDHSYEAEIKHSLDDHAFLFRGAEIQSTQLGLAAKAKARAWWPRLDAYAGVYQFNQREEEDYPNKGDRKESVLGLKLTVSLPAGADSLFEARALGKESSAAQTIADYERREVEVHLAGEKAELKLMHDQVHEAEENIRRSRDYYKITQSEYGRGVKNSPDVLGAADKLFAMKHKRLEIIRDFQLAKAHVLSKMGK